MQLERLKEQLPKMMFLLRSLIVLIMAMLRNTFFVLKHNLLLLAPGFCVRKNCII